MATFHPFPRLPAELRLQIWAMTVVPRIVDVNVEADTTPGPKRKFRDPPLAKLLSSTPVPAILQACQESRYQGLYEQAFTEIPHAKTTSRRYIWLNLEIDMISIGSCEMDRLTPVAPLIQRLRIARDMGEEFQIRRLDQLGLFINVKEIHIVCLDGNLENWYNTSDWYPIPCGEENLFFVHPNDGTMMGCIELNLMFDALEADEEKERDENIGEASS
ncbi:hypothetical protein NPX13_g4831 [Xylaria arbuscula]|uniref:2EXR domain-containing protein n=1 Tax=Xylaria arbuscula TaxID=114810 RepID=A0A9W8TN89_9PEZI|nr:hypothetical protein NPX13_g4831 [Xylaria arbuscula]